MSVTLDHLDKLAASAFDGYLVRKDLVRRYARQYPVPTYVVEFLLGRYCASTDEKEIAEGLEIVEKQLHDRTVRTGEEELFKARTRESGPNKLIDIVRARLAFDQKDGVNIMKGYMASGQFSRGKENIRADGCIVMVGNFDVDVEQQQKIGHLLSPLPPEMRNDTAFMDRLHAFVPGWEFPKLNPTDHFSDHFGRVSDFRSECWSRLRSSNRVGVMQARVHLGGALSGRDIEAVNKTVSGLTKLLFPDPELAVADADLEWIVRLALESRRRVKEQQKRCFKSEFRNTHFSYISGPDGIEQFVSTPELHSDEAIEGDPLPPGQVWAVSPGSAEAGPGLYRIEVTSGPGGGVKILNQPTPPAFRESVRVGEQNLYTRAKELVGDRDPRENEFTLQMRAMDADKTGVGLGLPVLVALCGALLGRNTRGGTIVVGALNLGGSIEMIPNAVRIAELAVDKQAQTLLMPVAARRQLNELPDELWTKVSIEFYRDASDGVFKALLD
jgi:ATP-dependent Lon protease